MIKPDKPDNEHARLAALRSYAILDTAPEDAFDDLVRIASAICGVPMASVSLIDQDRQWFKARMGIEAGESSRDSAFCAHAILSPDDVMVVPDALEDVRFHDNPLVQGNPNIRFYAGAPLVDTEGHALGTLCVLDNEPKVLSPHQLDALTVCGEAQRPRPGGSRGLRRTRPASPAQAALSASVVKLEPQPHSPATLGLRNRNCSFRPCLWKSISVPSTIGRLSASMKIRTPAYSLTTSPGRSSRARSTT